MGLPGGKTRRRPGIGHLAADEDRHTVVLRVAIALVGMAEQLPQYMHLSSLTMTLLALGLYVSPRSGNWPPGLISVPFWMISSLTLGGVRWIPRMAISLQCTAPHISAAGHGYP